jgi:hypothetical protein
MTILWSKRMGYPGLCGMSQYHVWGKIGIRKRRESFATITRKLICTLDQFLNSFTEAQNVVWGSLDMNKKVREPHSPIL